MAVGEQTLSEFGKSVCTAGDVNGDGYDDFLVGQHYFSGPEYREGRVAFTLAGPQDLQTVLTGPLKPTRKTPPLAYLCQPPVMSATTGMLISSSVPIPGGPLGNEGAAFLAVARQVR